MSETPGKLLSAAREQKSLSQEDIAKQIRLSVSAIDDIESDHYDSFGAATFVRGYLRSYARVVDIPEEKILMLWEATGSKAKLSTPVPLLVEGISTGARACQSDSCVNIPSRSVIVVGTLLVLGFIAWWVNQKPPIPVANTALLPPKTQVVATAIAVLPVKVPPAAVQPTAAIAVNPVKQKVVAHHHKQKDSEPLQVTYTVKPVAAEELASDH